MNTKDWKRIGWGAAVLGAAAGVYAILRYGDHFLDEFEDTAHDEAAEGEFVKTAAGWRIHFTVQGQGSPVVLIHGFLDSLRSWRRNAAVLAKTHRVYAIDVLGFGSSERVRDPIYTMKQQSAFLKEFFEQQQIAQADLVGHSMGGALALQFAYDFPASVHKVVLIAPATYIYHALPRYGLMRVPRRVTRGVMGLYEKIQEDRNNPLQFAYGDPERITVEAVDYRNRMMRVRGQHDALISMTQAKRDGNVPEGLPQVDVPTLIIAGRKDRVVPAAHALKHLSNLPNARLEWIENVGHLPHEEEPEQVNQLLVDFLDE